MTRLGGCLGPIRCRPYQLDESDRAQTHFMTKAGGVLRHIGPGDDRRDPGVYEEYSRA